MAEYRLLGGFVVNTYMASPTYEGKSIRLGLSVAPPVRDGRFSVRDGGKNGSGPYYNIRYHHESGVMTLFPDYNGDVCSTQMDLNRVQRSDYHYVVSHWEAHGEWCCITEVKVNPEWNGLVPGKSAVMGFSWLVGVRSDTNLSAYRTPYFSTVSTLSQTWQGEDIEPYMSILRSNTLDKYHLNKDGTTPSFGYTRVATQQLSDIERCGPGELYSAFDWWRITGCLPNGYQSMAGAAFVNAGQSLPRAQCNSIANALEVASTVRSFIKGDVSKFKPKDWKDLWLSYRYAYCTTKSDIEEYAELTRRLYSLAQLGDISSHGYASSAGVTCHTVISVSTDTIMPQGTKSFMDTWGLRLSATNVWDMIPYSFIADWFLHVGDFLSRCEDENWAIALPIVDSWTSFRRDDATTSEFFRVPGHFRSNSPWLDYSDGPSGKTIVKRIADTIALFG